LTVEVAQVLDQGVCAAAQVMDLTCAAAGLDDGRFLPRPTGSTRVFEANLEVRFRLASRLQGVAFVDAGQLWSATSSVDLGDIEVSPGTGVRFLSPIGPVRVDLGYRFRGGESLSVVTSQLRSFASDEDDPDLRIVVDGARIPFVKSDELAVLGPMALFEESSSLSWRRFQLHVSIGQAF